MNMKHRLQLSINAALTLALEQVTGWHWPVTVFVGIPVVLSWIGLAWLLYKGVNLRPVSEPNWPHHLTVMVVEAMLIVAMFRLGHNFIGTIWVVIFVAAGLIVTRRPSPR